MTINRYEYISDQMTQANDTLNMLNGMLLEFNTKLANGCEHLSLRERDDVLESINMLQANIDYIGSLVQQIGLELEELKK